MRAVLRAEKKLSDLSDDDLRQRSLSLRYRAKSGESLSRLLPEAFALVRQAATRTLGMSHFKVQLLGGIAMHYGSIAQMETGEGKTLTATLALFLNALPGKGAYLATHNDYLAGRDAETMRPVYEMLGMTLGVIQQDMLPQLRQQAYACDITYGTAHEFGFDFLRDRLTLRDIQEHQSGESSILLTSNGENHSRQLLQRRPYFALIDEADSILIDGARTPLIIGVQSQVDDETSHLVACYRWGANVSTRFIEHEHYQYDPKKKSVELTTAGRQFVRDLSKPAEMDSVGMTHIYQFAERAIQVERDFLHDRDYIVRGDEVVIVDESTGRLAEGRKWRDGIHAAIEAKEGLSMADGGGGGGGGHAAQITLPVLFSNFEKLAGMTGTAASSAREFRKVYGTPVVSIATNRPCLRVRLPDKVFGNAVDKWEAIVEEVKQMHELGRPVLVGTRSINRSEALAFLLEQADIEYNVLHAKYLDQEANFVTQAGHRGKVTVSTNMAGRGTDIGLGEGVAELGGLHVICTEVHDSARIDRQLAGRSARQGDPGSYRQFAALDDDILAEGFGPEKSERSRQLGLSSNGPFDHLAGMFRTVQKKVELRHFRDRKALKDQTEQRTKKQKQMGQDPYLDSVG